PFWDFLDRGGKRWRPALLLLACEALGGDSEKFLDFAVIPEIIHNGTLIADDVEDSSDLRRGKPCTYKIFGLDIAVNISHVMFFLPMLVLKENQNKITVDQSVSIYEAYVRSMVNLSLGQAIDLAWHRGLANANQATVEQYLQMCTYKTGTLARLAAEIGAILADAEDNTVRKIGKFAESIGVAFQIQDDILDIIGVEFAKKKGGLGMDITEGKRSLMVIYTLQRAEPEDRKRLIEILNLHTNEEKLKMEAINIMKKYESIRYARKLASRLKNEGWNQVKNVLPPSKAKMMLSELANYLIERSI
ncbi:TPA: polyprenyl synthetase family protein, partial [Candidatus Bathyarchaeota archaeon]|nr:polyprenyl synthetase family protein [Candidatus Bathyarchaeota archaeon]